jgi:hypothetical protein
MFETKHLLFVITTVLTVVTAMAQPTLEKTGETTEVFKGPAAVCIDAKLNMVYVSNVNGSNLWAKDNNGSVGRMQLNGSSLQGEWIRGLHSPKGMGLVKDILYVADLNEIVVIDIGKQEIKKKITVPQAEQLNDVTVDAKGTLYISDTKGKRVYMLKGGAANPYLEGLMGPKGVCWFKENLYLIDRSSLYRAEYDRKLTLLAEGFEGGAEGLVAVNDSEFIVSCRAGILYYVKANGSKEILLDLREKKIDLADISFDPATRILYAPTFSGNKVLTFVLK